MKPAETQFQCVVPVFRIFDEVKAKEFYLGFLGFQIDWEHRLEDNFPLYAQISRGNFVLHLSEHHGDASPGSSLYVETTKLSELQRELTARDYKYAKPTIVELPWGREMKVIDPFSNSIRFCDPADSAEEEGVSKTI